MRFPKNIIIFLSVQNSNLVKRITSKEKQKKNTFWEIVSQKVFVIIFFQSEWRLILNNKNVSKFIEPCWRSCYFFVLYKHISLQIYFSTDIFLHKYIANSLSIVTARIAYTGKFLNSLTEHLMLLSFGIHRIFCLKAFFQKTKKINFSSSIIVIVISRIGWNSLPKFFFKLAWNVKILII